LVLPTKISSMKKLPTKVRKSQYMLVVIFGLPFNVNAQNPLLNSAKAQLRSLFSQIIYPSPNVKFLSERSAKLSDSFFYQNNSPDTLDFDEWLQL
jgi:ABC-type phosphate transport system substrate-binding protein